MSFLLMSGLAVMFILGAAVASFLGNVSFRLGHGRPAFAGRSQCDHCAAPIPWWALIPIVGYLLTGGRCGSCAKRVSARYPLFEFALGTVTALGFWHTLHMADAGVFSGDWQYAVYLIFLLWIIVVLGMITIYDIDYLLILDKITYPAIVITTLFKFALPGATLQTITADLLTGGVSALFIWIIVRVTRERGMGFGDIKLAFLVGLLGGWPNGLLAIWLAFIIGAITGLLLVAVRRKGLRTQIPFGPFLSLGGMISLLYGDWLMHWYFQQFLLI